MFTKELRCQRSVGNSFQKQLEVAPRWNVKILAVTTSFHGADEGLQCLISSKKESNESCSCL